jgi:hypothetical protein
METLRYSRIRAVMSSPKGVGEMKATLDRFEGNVAVLLVRDDESIKFNMPIALLPEGYREGDILDISITRDVKATEDSKAGVSSLMDRLKKKDQEGSELIQDPE